jgi:hypothetical protein
MSRESQPSFAMTTHFPLPPVRRNTVQQTAVSLRPNCKIAGSLPDIDSAWLASVVDYMHVAEVNA